MSTYAVFGMTRARAVELARKKVKTNKRNARGTYDALSASEWEVEVQAAADAIMASKQTVQLSEAYDAPHFAFDYLHLAERTTDARGLHVKSHGKTGDNSPRTGRPILTWEDVNESELRSASR